jgi:hypothetical protein
MGESIALFYQTECVVRDLDDIATVLCVFKHMPYNSNFCLLGNGCILSGEMEYNPFTDTNIRCVVDGQIFYKNISWPVCGQVTDNLWRVITSKNYSCLLTTGIIASTLMDPLTLYGILSKTGLVC